METADEPTNYETLVRGHSAAHPLTANFLLRANNGRARRWQQFLDPLDFRAIECLLEYLQTASNTLASANGSADLAFLASRIADDVGTALEGILGGRLQIASDAMRDIIETELLVDDFTFTPSRIGIWRSANEVTLRNEFSAGALRKRKAVRLGVPVKNVPGAEDYRAHSQLLHVTPPRLFGRSPEYPTRAAIILDSIRDIMFHGISSVGTVGSFVTAATNQEINSDSVLAAVNAAREDLDSAQSAVRAIEKNAAAALSTDESTSVAIFEDGTAFSVAPESKEVKVYKTSRADFRTFHRVVFASSSETVQLTEISAD